ncbi:MAG TPA: FAD:protein FMN transferase [Longimicrobiales bacterium]|nr:FAD:protein FMN transferase [Longimicrobiales bacterium]
MGTRFELVLPAADAAVGEAALAEIEYWHARLNRFAADSLVSHLNRFAAAAPVRIDAATFALLRVALDVCRASDGAFDITLGGGADALELDEPRSTVRFQSAAVRIDLGGIAKGHALEQAAALLRAHGTTQALLHGGTSSVLALGSAPSGDGWKVALGPEPDAPVVALQDRALSLSANVARDHVLDPRARSEVPARTVAVIGPDACRADAWSTALLVLGSRPAGLDVAWQTHFRGAQ